MSNHDQKAKRCASDEMVYLPARQLAADIRTS